MTRKLHLTKYFLLACFFVFLVLGVEAFGADPDFIFDKFLTAGVFLFLYYMYTPLHMNLKILALLFITIILHQLKLYGNVYFGWIQFDMIMHAFAGFAITLALYQYLINEEPSYRRWFKTALFAMLAMLGLSAIHEIIEFFGYANLPPGGGILHYGLGDEGGWIDVIWDLISNLIGASSAAVLMAVIYLKKYKKKVKHLVAA